MPKKQKTRQRFYTSTTNNNTTKQQLTKTYWRWFHFGDKTGTTRLALGLKLPGYFTHEYELNYLWRKKDKLKF